LNLKQEETNLDNKSLNFDPTSIKEYINLVGYNESNLLSKLRKETKKFGPLSIMQIGPTQGTLIGILCQLGKFKKCLEIGVFTGYSSICIANNLSDDGELFALDNNEEYTKIAKKYWKLAKVDKKINLMLDDACLSLDILCKTMQETFDFIFIDADKNNYMKYYEDSLLLLKPQGLIAIDNTIWKGRVTDETDKSKSTETIRNLNKFIKNDNRVEHCILTIYDGMTLCIKK
tara:strand:- start:1049 stop:1741 length:693 start_codon:yes stop_codon:yes gene_type:complete